MAKSIPAGLNLPRVHDLEAMFAFLSDMQCVSVIGVSNTGKSALLRSLTDIDVQTRYLGNEAGDRLFIYVDFNQMLEMTEQAFYELVLRSAIDVLRKGENAGDLLRRLEEAYTRLVAPSSRFEIPLSFSQAMNAIAAMLPQRVIFLFDEIDAPLAEIPGRVFLNLRALHDSQEQRLSCVVATNRRLEQICSDPDVMEFAEMFAGYAFYPAFLADGEAEEFLDRAAAYLGATFGHENRSFLCHWAGGHPGLLAAGARVLGLLTGKPERDRSQDTIIHRRAAEILAQDIHVLTECRNIWNDLSSGEQEALVAVSRDPDAADTQDVESVTAKHLVVGEGPERRLFGRAFSEFVQRQTSARAPADGGLRVDPESGEVWVNGQLIPTLTNLEYRLVLLLYGRMGKICTKYDVVEAVWGEEYIDEVDDARIEKLVSRVRQKIEPDAANPHYLLTVRGRGYKLVRA